MKNTHFMALLLSGVIICKMDKNLSKKLLTFKKFKYHHNQTKVFNTGLKTCYLWMESEKNSIISLIFGKNHDL